MKNFLMLILSIVYFFGLRAQDSTIEVQIHKLFNKMYEADTNGFSAMFTEEPIMQTVAGTNEEAVLKTGDLKNWMNTIVAHNPGDLDEQIGKIKLRKDGAMVHAWVPYRFYYKGNYSHCGVNSFQLIRLKGSWKLASVMDTRRKNCEQGIKESELDSIMNSWHVAASTANEKVFFGRMKPDGVYIGTDPSELWTAEEMESWAKQYFQRDTAWHFTPIDRNWYFSADGSIAWFDELLDTWMGICRSSGVLENDAGDWKLRHYHLSVTILNEKMEDFLKIDQE